MSTTATTATTTSTNTGPPSCWRRGHVFAQNLPSRQKGEDFQKHRPIAAQIDPHVLKAGCGPLHYHPRRCLAVDRRRSLSSLKEDAGIIVNTVMLAVNLKKQDDEPKSISTKDETLLSVYIHPQSVHADDDDDENGNNTANNMDTAITSSVSASDEQSLYFQMIRDSLEPASKTLTRMGLSLSKKLLQQGKKKKHKKKKTAGGADNVVRHEVWAVDPLDNNRRVYQQDNLSSMTSKQLWNVAVEKSLLVELVLDDSRVVSLLIESGGPFIKSVYTFEDFGPCLFPDIPVCVDVGLSQATHCQFDWYVGGKLQTSQSQTVKAELRNDNNIPGSPLSDMASACYIPSESDIGQELAVLLTPMVLIPSESSSSEISGEDPSSARPGPVIQHLGEGCQEAYRFQMPVQARPENTLLNLRSQFLQCPKPAESFRVLTYNILADQNAYQLDSSSTEKIPYLPYVSKEVLARERRMPLILHEILSYQAQVLCLQEVDKLVFDSLLQPVLRLYNYQGYYARKEGTNEGCAIFWSLDFFEHVPVRECKSMLVRDLVQQTYYAEQGTIAAEDESTRAVAGLFEARPDLRQILETTLGHVVLMVRLKVLRADNNTTNTDGSISEPQEETSSNHHNKRSLLVVNTHLFFHPQASHLRLVQAHMICHKIVSEQQQQHWDNNWPAFDKSIGDDSSSSSSTPFAIVFCGDFNSSLTNAAGKLIVDRSVKGDFRDLQAHLDVFRWGARGQICDPSSQAVMMMDDNDDGNHQVKCPDIQLPEKFPHMITAYPDAPAFTHYVDGFVEALDHILIQSNALQTVRQAPMPSVQDVTADTAMPSATLPSDHVSLFADLQFRRRRRRTDDNDGL